MKEVNFPIHKSHEHLDKNKEFKTNYLAYQLI